MHLEADVCGPIEDAVMVQAFAHLLGSAEVGVGGVEELIEAETGCVIADEAVGLSPQSRFGDLTQPGQVFGIGDHGGAGSEDPRFDPVRQLGEIGVDDRQLHLVEGRLRSALRARLGAREHQPVPGGPGGPGTA